MKFTRDMKKEKGFIYGILVVNALFSFKQFVIRGLSRYQDIIKRNDNPHDIIKRIKTFSYRDDSFKTILLIL